MKVKLLSFATSLLLLFSLHDALAQLSPPQAQGVYGGRILAIENIWFTADSTRLFITTESANSAFFADIYHPMGGAPIASDFQIVPALNGAAGFGNSIREIEGHSQSGRMFFIRQGDLYSTHPRSVAIVKLDSLGVEKLLIEGDQLLYIKGKDLHFGILTGTGAFSENAASPITLPALSGPPVLSIQPITGQVYIFGENMHPKLYRSTDSLASFSTATGFVDVSPASIGGVVRWSSFGIAPDGRRFCAGSDFAQKYIAYSDNDSSWTHYATGFGGAAGSNLAFGEDSSGYHVYYSTIFNDDRGKTGHWNSFGSMGKDSHPNDGAVAVNPLDPNLVLMTTDVGLGLSINRGPRIFDINEGIEAVQVNDFDMTVDKNTAWLASKSGIRKVSTYLNNPRWTQPIFPMGDGSPYHAAAMAPNDTNTVYAGNLRVYKSKNGGQHWQRVFTAEDPPYNYPSAGNLSTGAASITSLEVCPYDTSIIFAGYKIEWGGKGGLFVSMDGGNSWEQILLDASTIGYDTDVHDILFHLEGADTVAYIGVEYELSAPAGRSVYRLTKSGLTWTVAQDMDAGGTSTGSLIVASIRDLAKSPTGDTLLAVGTDAGVNHPIAYYKPLNSTGVWTPFTTSGFPFGPGLEGKAITMGVDTVYAAVGSDVYYFPVADSLWTLGYAYPNGTKIQFLYFDELLVGTETGLYGHQGLSQNVTSIWKLEENTSMQIQMYPNPARSGHIELRFSNQEREAFSLRILTTTGQEVYRQANILGEQVVLRHDIFATTGLYLIQMKGKNKHYFGKLMIE
ncbi:MAG: T9SS type A sorting domain-containing protein [Bacteroidota bacterium]